MPQYILMIISVSSSNFTGDSITFNKQVIGAFGWSMYTGFDDQFSSWYTISIKKTQFFLLGHKNELDVKTKFFYVKCALLSICV